MHCAPASSDGAAAAFRQCKCHTPRRQGHTLQVHGAHVTACPPVKSTESSKTSNQIKSVYMPVSLQSEPGCSQEPSSCFNLVLNAVPQNGAFSGTDVMDSLQTPACVDSEQHVTSDLAMRC